MSFPLHRLWFEQLRRDPGPLGPVQHTVWQPRLRRAGTSGQEEIWPQDRCLVHVSYQAYESKCSLLLSLPALPFEITAFLMRMYYINRLWHIHSAILWGPAFHLWSFWSFVHKLPGAFTKICLDDGEIRKQSPVLPELASGFTNHSYLSPACNPLRAFHPQHLNKLSLGAWALSLQDSLHCPPQPPPPLLPLHLLPRPLLPVPRTH